MPWPVRISGSWDCLGGGPYRRFWGRLVNQWAQRSAQARSSPVPISPNTGVGMFINSLSAHPEAPKLAKSLVRMQHVMEFRNHRLEVRGEMEADVLRQLRAGRLVAYGYVAGRNLNTLPVKIPDRFFE